MADSSIAVSLTRTDEPRPVAQVVRRLEDAGARESIQRDIAAGAGSTENILWTSPNDGNGSAFTANSFARLALIVDPKNDLAADDPTGLIGVWVKAYYTPIAGGSSTALGIVFFVQRRNGAFMIPSSIAASGVTVTREITKLSVFNANASDDVTVQLEIERAPA